jgi:lipopolysaccharide export system protein LptC
MKAVRSDRFSTAESRADRRLTPWHSLRVLSLKLLLPIIALLIVAVIFAWPDIASNEKVARLSPTTVTRADSETLRMLNATFVGEDEGRKPFTVIAKSATQSESSPNRVDLEEPKADLLLADGSWVAARADRGVFDRVERTLALAGNVRVFHDSGAEVLTSEAFLEMDEGRATGRKPLEAQSASGRITGEGFDITDRGLRILVHGRAHATLYSDGQKRSGVTKP